MCRGPPVRLHSDRALLGSAPFPPQPGQRCRFGAQPAAVAATYWLGAAAMLMCTCDCCCNCLAALRHMRRLWPSHPPPSCTAPRHRLSDGLLKPVSCSATRKRRQCDPRAAGASPRGRAKSGGRATNSWLLERTVQAAIGAPEPPAVHAPLAAAAAAAAAAPHCCLPPTFTIPVATHQS